MAGPGPILIAGGGIGGLALALALAQRSRRSIVLEARAAFAAAGAGIQLGPNGVRALGRLGVADALQPAAGVPGLLEVHDGASGTRLAALPLGAWLAARHGAPYWAVHRADLHGALLAAAAADPAIALRTGFAVERAVEGEAHVEALDASGASVRGAALVGADGLWSSVRRHVAPHVAPVFTGATATRSVIPAADAGALASGNVGLWLRPGANIVHYPVRGGAEVAVVVIAVAAWQGREWDAEADPARLRATIQRFHPRLAGALATAPRWQRWALYRLPPLPRWTQGRITLIGDAAHPMLPHLAQGGVLALEDAIVLADCLAAAPAGDEPAALAAYEAQRRQRAARVQAASRRNGRIYQLAPPFSWARNAALRTIPGPRLIAAYDWLYGWQPGASDGAR